MRITSGPINTIRNVIDQACTTQINIGHIQGHFISHGQVEAINQALELISDGKTVNAVKEEEPIAPAELLARKRAQLSDQINSLQLEIALVDPVKRPSLNERLHNLLSKRARIDRAFELLP